MMRGSAAPPNVMLCAIRRVHILVMHCSGNKAINKLDDKENVEI